MALMIDENRILGAKLMGVKRIEGTGESANFGIDRFVAIHTTLLDNTPQVLRLALPNAVADALIEAWGEHSNDPLSRQGQIDATIFWGVGDA